MPNYLTYSPSIEAYVAARRGDEVQYYDLSNDITSCKITRRVNEASEFSLTLSNKNRKYNGLFMAMDRIAIQATKVEKHRLLTGYITSADAFSLYAKDIKLSGKCSLYHLQQTFWDELLIASQDLVLNSYSEPLKDGGLWKVAYNLVKNVGRWNGDSIMISAEIPAEVLSWAASLYASQKQDLEQANSIMKAFETMLKEHGPKLSGGATSVGTAAAGESGGITLSGDEAKASADQKAIVAKATSGTVPGEGGMCLKWVGDVYEAAGYPFARYWGAIEVWKKRASHIAYGDGKTGIPVGAAVVTTGSNSGGAGHIGIYIGNGEIISEVGGKRTETVEQFGSWASDNIDGMQGWCGWVCPDCGADWK